MTGKQKHRNRTRRQARRALNTKVGAVVRIGRKVARYSWGAGLTRTAFGKGEL